MKIMNVNKIFLILFFLFLTNVVSASSYKINDVVYYNVNKDSSVLIFGCEGATDKKMYNDIIKNR